MTDPDTSPFADVQAAFLRAIPRLELPRKDGPACVACIQNETWVHNRLDMRPLGTGYPNAVLLGTREANRSDNGTPLKFSTI